ATVVVCGPHTLLVSSDAALTWRHLPLPALARGDSVQSVDFVTPRSGLLLTNFRDLWRTADAGRHWRLDLANAGAGADLSFSDPRHGWLSAPGFANRFDGYVLRTID